MTCIQRTIKLHVVLRKDLTLRCDTVHVVVAHCKCVACSLVVRTSISSCCAYKTVEAECENERTVQLAFGLSSMTALRLGDMQHLRWCDIKMIDGVPTISIIQRKTKRPAIIPLNEMAQSLLPPRTDDNPESLVFHLVKKSDNVSKYVRRLKEKAGIEKDLTYHCSRHTTASLAISAGADISAVKDVLGHGSITSTEVYAKVALEKKIEAVNLFNGVFD